MPSPRMFPPPRAALVYFAKILQEKLGNPIHKKDSGRRVGNAVAAAREWQNFDVVSLFNELVD